MNQSIFPYFTIYPHKSKKIFQGSQALNFLKRLVSQTYNNSTRKAIQTVFRVLLPFWGKYIISLPKSPRSTKIHARRIRYFRGYLFYLSIHLFVIYREPPHYESHLSPKAVHVRPSSQDFDARNYRETWHHVPKYHRGVTPSPR